MIKTSLMFYPEKDRKKDNEALVQSVTTLMEMSADLSVETGLPVSVTLQHSLKSEEFAVLVECGMTSFGSYFKTPKKVFDSISNQIERFIGAAHASKQTKKSPTRTKDSRRDGRKNSTRLGGSGLLQGGRKSSR